MSGLVVRGVATSAPDSVTVRTFLEDGTARFASKGKRTRATELVIHETVTRSVDSTIAVLKKRGLSVHFVLGPDGELDDLESLREAGAAFEPEVEPGLMQRPEHMGDPVVLLDQRGGDSGLVCDLRQQRCKARFIMDEVHTALASVSWRAPSTKTSVAFVP